MNYRLRQYYEVFYKTEVTRFLMAHRRRMKKFISITTHKECRNSVQSASFDKFKQNLIDYLLRNKRMNVQENYYFSEFRSKTAKN